MQEISTVLAKVMQSDGMDWGSMESVREHVASAFTDLHMIVDICLSVYLSTYLSIYLSDCLSIIYSSIHHLSINLPIIYQSIYPSSISHLSIIYFSTENWTLGLNYTRQVLFHHTPPTPSPYLASLMV